MKSPVKRAKCFPCVFGQIFLWIEGKIITKCGIKGVKVAQMLVFGSKMVTMGDLFRHEVVTR